MDEFYGQDSKLGILGDSGLGEFIDDDRFYAHESPMNTEENDWLNSLFDDPILNDKMMTDAVQEPRIQSEHSYSLNDNGPLSPLGLGKIEDFDSELQGMPFVSQRTHNASQIIIKQEPPSPTTCQMFTSASCSSSSSSSLLESPSPAKQPTIILATSHPSNQQSVLPKISIKAEPNDTLEQALEQTIDLDSMILPPTPPSSSGTVSDSDGSVSPQRSETSSPSHSPLRIYDHHITVSDSLSFASSSYSKSLSQPLFTNPIPQSGVLTLTEEEKRTLISEGYPVPSKLPLTKQEEKNLKKIRRKIKNKISAQESRRKKKEYLETLERRVEQFNQENIDLKRKVDSLENNNRSLISQLHKLQSLVGKATPAHAGSVLMVLVLCFAVFVGSWAPSLNIGYSPSSSHPGPAIPFTNPYLHSISPAMGPEVEKVKCMASSDPYSTPNIKSRVLMGFKDEYEDDYMPSIPGGLDGGYCPENMEPDQPRNRVMGPENPSIESKPVTADDVEDITVTSVTVTITGSAETMNKSLEVIDQDTMHPDIAVPVVENRFNVSAEMETVR